MSPPLSLHEYILRFRLLFYLFLFFFLYFFFQKECYSQAARATAASLAWLTPSFCTHIGLLRGANKAEAQVVVAVVRVVAAPVADRRAFGVEVP